VTSFLPLLTVDDDTDADDELLADCVVTELDCELDCEKTAGCPIEPSVIAEASTSASVARAQ
jgi:hypothetical protein